jgi:hypothetical protein
VTDKPKKKNFFTKKWLANLRRRCVVKLLRAVSNVVMVCSNSLQFHFEKYFTKKKVKLEEDPQQRRLAQWMEMNRPIHTHSHLLNRIKKEYILHAAQNTFDL